MSGDRARANGQSDESGLLRFIETELLREAPVEPLGADDDLLGTGLIDSLGVVRLVEFLEAEFGITVPHEDVRIEHFLTVAHIVTYIQSRRGAGERE